MLVGFVYSGVEAARTWLVIRESQTEQRSRSAREAMESTFPQEPLAAGVQRLLKSAVDAGPGRARFSAGNYVSYGRTRALDEAMARSQDVRGLNGLGYTPDATLGAPLSEFSIEKIEADASDRGARVVLSKGARRVSFAVGRENGRWCFAWAPVWIEGEVAGTRPEPSVEHSSWSSTEVQPMIDEILLHPPKTVADAIALYPLGDRALLGALSEADVQAQGAAGRLGLPLYALSVPKEEIRWFGIANGGWDFNSPFETGRVTLSDGARRIVFDVIRDGSQWAFRASSLVRGRLRPGDVGYGVAKDGSPVNPLLLADVEVEELWWRFTRLGRQPALSDVLALYPPSARTALRAMDAEERARRGAAGELGMPLSGETIFGTRIDQFSPERRLEPDRESVLRVEVDAENRTALLTLHDGGRRLVAKLTCNETIRWYFAMEPVVLHE